MRRWRNWQTRRSQKPVPKGLGVQLPPSAFSLKMNPFYFSPLRWRVFLTLIATMLLLPISLFLAVRIPVIGTILGGVAFIGAILLVHIPGVIFREPLFRFEEFGAIPQGILGWATVVVFWIAIAFLFSWPANCWRGREHRTPSSR